MLREGAGVGNSAPRLLLQHPEFLRLQLLFNHGSGLWLWFFHRPPSKPRVDEVLNNLKYHPPACQKTCCVV